MMEFASARAMIQRKMRAAAQRRARSMKLADFWWEHLVIPDKLRSSADPGSIVDLRSPPMDPGSSPG